MTGLHKFSLKALLITLAFAVLFCKAGWGSKNIRSNNIFFYTFLTADTIKPLLRGAPLKSPQPLPIDTLPITRPPVSRDTIRPATRDSIVPRTDTFAFKISKDTLDAPVRYKAEDSAVVIVADEQIILYGKTNTTYKDVVLDAPKVALENRTGLVTAYNEKDSTGGVATRAKFKQGDNAFESDTIQFNFKTQRGITRNTFTQQQEMFIQGEQIKKVSANTVFVKRGLFTTCNFDEPHFAFRANKMKLINNQVAVSGPVHPEFEGVPVPLYLPFGYFPLRRGRHSGLLAPTFTATEQFGLGLEGLGYYQVLNDYYDITLRTNIYSYGGWMVNLTPTYRKRYRYNGILNLSVNSTKINFKGDPDFTKSTNYFVTWSHNVDQKARPGTTFTANVNAGSTRFNQFLVNNPLRNFQNQLGSSITYTKSWAGKPYNLSLSANHTQNNNQRLIYITLPDAGFTVNTLYPFQRKEVVGAQKWYEKLGIAYNGVARNQLAFYDTARNTFKNLADTLQWGVQHRVPITLALPPLGPFIVSPAFSYEEQWMQRRMRRTWNDNTKKTDTTFNRGFFTARQISMGLNFSTQLFGTYSFKKGSVAAIRHVVRPIAGLNYTPALNRRDFYEVQIDTFGRRERFSVYEGNLFPGFNGLAFGGLSFGIDNNLEMKVRSKKDTTVEEKKLRLIDGFGFNSSYNFLQDSLQLGDFNFYLRSTLFDKVNITATANVSPYGLNDFGTVVNRFVWTEGTGFRPGRLTGGMLAISTQFQSKPRDPEKAAQQRQQATVTDPLLLADQQRLMDYMQRNPTEFVDFNTPWSLSLDLSVNFFRQRLPDLSRFQNVVNAGLNFNNSFSLTPKWNFSTFGNFDLKEGRLGMFSMAISRDLHCWQMAISVSPVGLQRSFSISISPKSGLLQDLRVNRTRVFTNY